MGTVEGGADSEFGTGGSAAITNSQPASEFIPYGYLHAALITDKTERFNTMQEALAITLPDPDKRMRLGLDGLVRRILKVSDFEGMGPVNINNVGKISDAIVDIATEMGIPDGLLLKLLDWTNTDQTLALRIATVAKILENRPEILEDTALVGLIRERAKDLTRYSGPGNPSHRAIELLGVLGEKESVQMLVKMIPISQQSTLKEHNQLLWPIVQSLAKIWKDDPETALVALAKATGTSRKKAASARSSKRQSGR